MSQYVIPALEQVSVPVVGTTARFPVQRIYCVGRNYVDHAQEMGFTGREPPFFFIKPANTVVVANAGEVATVPYPALTKDFQHEIELVACIGTGGKNIKAADAKKHIYGYAVGLDMTRRDLQGEQKKLGRPWCIGKSFLFMGLRRLVDFCPLNRMEYHLLQPRKSQDCFFRNQNILQTIVC